MAVPTPTPIFPDDGFKYLMGGFEAGVGQFCFEYDGALYMFGSGSADYNFRPYKLYATTSTDGGATWTQLDAENSPVSSVGNVLGSESVDNFTCVRDGSIVRFVGTDVRLGSYENTPAWAVSFDLDSKTWGALATFPAIQIYGYQAVFQLILRGVGDYILFYNGPTPKYVTFNGAAFGTPVAVPVGEGGYAAFSGVVDSSGVTHLLAWSGTGVGHIALDAENSFGEFQEILGEDEEYYTGPFNSPPSVLKIVTIEGVETLAFSVLGVLNSDTGVVPMLFVSAPVAASPTWSVLPAIAGGKADGDSELMPDLSNHLWLPTCVEQSASGTLYIVWTHAIYDAEEDIYFVQWWKITSLDGVTWSASPDVLFQTPAPINNNWHGWNAIYVALAAVTGGMGVWGGSINLYSDDLGASDYQVQYCLSPEGFYPSPGGITWTSVPAGSPGAPSVTIGGQVQTNCPPAFELSKVVVALRPAKHLPVRGSLN